MGDEPVEITLGELGRRMDTLSKDMRQQISELKSDLRTQHVPRGEVVLMIDGVRAYADDIDHTLGAEIAANKATIEAIKAQIEAHHQEQLAAKSAVRAGLWFPIIVAIATSIFTAGLTAVVALVLATH